MDRPAKLARLNRFRRKLPFASAVALQEVLRAVQDDGIPELHNIDHLRQARDLENPAPTPYGPIMQFVEVIHLHCYGLQWIPAQGSIA